MTADPAWQARAESFDEGADLYDRYRPRYPDEVFDDLVSFGGLVRGDRIVEVGAGTGRATRSLVDRGLEVTAIEPGENMSRLLRSNCEALPGVSCVMTTFETWTPDAGEPPFDGLVSAQAWHWVDEEVALSKAHAVIRPGGVIALVWNRPAPDNSELRGQLDAVYTRVAPSLADSSMLVQSALTWWNRRGQQSPRLEEMDDRFGDLQVREYPWVNPYSTEEYLGLMQTHSDHRLLEATVLDELLDETATVIDAHGGQVDFAYITDLVLARRR